MPKKNSSLESLIDQLKMEIHILQKQKKPIKVSKDILYDVHKRSLPPGKVKKVAFNLPEIEAWSLTKKLTKKLEKHNKDSENKIKYYFQPIRQGIEQDLDEYFNDGPAIKIADNQEDSHE